MYHNRRAAIEMAIKGPFKLQYKPQSVEHCKPLENWDCKETPAMEATRGQLQHGILQAQCSPAFGTWTRQDLHANGAMVIVAMAAYTVF